MKASVSALNVELKSQVPWVNREESGWGKEEKKKGGGCLGGLKDERYGEEEKTTKKQNVNTLKLNCKLWQKEEECRWATETNKRK